MGNRFAGTSAVVSGASSGIGRAIAVALAQAGVADLVIHYCRNRQGAEQTAAEVVAHGCQVTLLAADLSVPAEVTRLAESVGERLGTIDTWVNNAGADVLTGDAGKLGFEEKLNRLWQVDVLGTIQLSRLASERMLRQVNQQPASMTFIGWDQAAQGMEGEAGQMFAPIKAAVMAFAASLAQSLAPAIRVNTVAPGWIQTSWGESTSEYWDRRARQQSLMQRWGTAEDVARAVLFAADPANTFLTGQTIDVNGGWNRKFPPGD